MSIDVHNVLEDLFLLSTFLVFCSDVFLLPLTYLSPAFYFLSLFYNLGTSQSE
jgi:hypothetical protein